VLAHAMNDGVALKAQVTRERQPHAVLIPVAFDIDASWQRPRGFLGRGYNVTGIKEWKWNIILPGIREQISLRNERVLTRWHPNGNHRAHSRLCDRPMNYKTLVSIIYAVQIYYQIGFPTLPGWVLDP
jgi:hypothetical protein